MTNFGFSGALMRKTAGIFAGVSAAAIFCSAARAATVEGTIITNQALVTYHSLSNALLTTSYLVTAPVVVINPNILTQKVAYPPMQVAGGTVKFCIWVVNASQYASAWSVIVHDKIDGNATTGGFSYAAGGLETWSGTPGSTVNWGYWGPGLGQVPTLFSDNLEAPDGVLGYSIRFLIEPMGPGQSAMVCFRARVL